MRSTVIPGFDNYTIYENGDVHSKRRNTAKGGIMKPQLANNGYFQVQLCKEGKTKKFRIHRLLGIAFIPNPENKPCIDHIDRNKLNNNLNNLRWATVIENNNNMPPSKGCIRKDPKYGSYRFFWQENKKRKSKRFKTLADAETYKENRFLKLRMEPPNDGDDQSTCQLKAPGDSGSSILSLA